MSSQPLLPSKKGLREAQDLFRKLRKKEPTPELIKIIEEVTHLPEPRESGEKNEKNDDGVAASGTRRHERDLDI